ncbi:RHS repeat domain-containing protein [Fulvivirga kasyanovii]|uniref:RHS repeat-associated core domain-containing protein n=1 Tax=Fulvivirga kasyanovii TaxID=396812 RepID=A0ABW9RIB6_9BACT|nr:RHS repeat-associated core domain-containing protein [Fulvivirga kasyanovii]MTI23743.1 hypothetical protein [Fulvivirga kasyanovii]
MGNTRLTFTTKPKTIEFTGRFESETAAEEEELFSNLKETREAFNSADATASDIHVAGDDEVVMLNNSQIAGPAISLPVGPGDKIDIEVYSYYEAGDYGNLQPADAILAAVAGAFGGANGGNTFEQSTYDAFTAENGTSLVGNGNDAGDTRPAAYLNYILFDEQMNFQKDGFAQVDVNANTHEVLALNDIVVEKAGFIYIYLSESNSSSRMFFDDMKVVLSEGNVVQSDNFYPYGMEMAGGFKRVTAKDNRFLFNQGTGDKTFNTERITDLGLSMDMTKYRTYDYTTGRFMQVDPLTDQAGQEIYTPYQYSFNNPIRYNDPYGDCPKCWAIAKGIVDFANGAVNAVASNNTTVVGADGETVLVQGFERETRDNAAFTAGQMAGDAFSVLQGSLETVGGGALATGGTVGGAVTSPTIVGGVVGAAAAGGVVIVAHGANTARNGLNNLLNADGKIYKVPGEDTNSGKPYVGRTKQSSPSKRGKRDGRDRSNAEIIDEYDSPEEGVFKEQRAIEQEGGIENLDNQRNEIKKGSKREEYFQKKYGGYGID